ncbi:DUF3180 domain-containing protein [Allostreptomyces psammosilenae]|uniref:DUF3180 domain-containing protein n=1 Tax=Allostreptomyces psammosilenae TaxID=1892865 RepID=A0A852ZTE5_9ACTN|nr:DUF3180 domain-containing protein [Allostreptomyces psammosilenae]NYI05683.1 hypothetical protein [Allostreptomyces psammosilenae]
MKPLRLSTLVATAAVTGLLSWGAFGLWRSYGTVPGVPPAAPIVLLLIAAALGATAITFRNRLREQRDRVPGARGVNPLVAARAVVFGQASALVSSAVLGVYAGLGTFLLPDWSVSTRRGDIYLSGLSVLAAVAVIAAAFLLERICRLPEDPEALGAPADEGPDTDHHHPHF